MKQAAVVLWTGGKDSCLALYRAYDLGILIKGLATFIPENENEFKAHPRFEMEKQAEVVSLPIHFLKVKEPYWDGYVTALKWLKEHLEIDAVITGDIDLVNGNPNWIGECCKGLGIDVICPLWRRPRESLLQELIDRGIEARVTWINNEALPFEWRGRIIDEAFLKDIKDLAKNTGIDICGENGEYHTMVAKFPVTKV
jgi:diphthine-ammonia ligase